MSWLEQVAPTIATALGGPLAGLAVTAISKVIGVSEDAVQKTIESGKLSADQIAQLKIAEIEFQKQTQELGLNFEKLATDDRKSARDLQTAEEQAEQNAKDAKTSTLAKLSTLGLTESEVKALLG